LADSTRSKCTGEIEPRAPAAIRIKKERSAHGRRNRVFRCGTPYRCTGDVRRRGASTTSSTERGDGRGQVPVTDRRISSGTACAGSRRRSARRVILRPQWTAPAPTQSTNRPRNLPRYSAMSAFPPLEEEAENGNPQNGNPSKGGDAKPRG
jgi:hypothetical protein